MAFPFYRQALLSENYDDSRILNEFFHTGPSHVFVGAPPGTEAVIKQAIAHAVRELLHVKLHALQLVVCGSAHLGFSPVPNKLGSPFNPVTSDIDIAIVSADLFELWWSDLQGCRMPQSDRTQMHEDLFWGLINPAIVSNHSEMGRMWWGIFGQLLAGAPDGPMLARGIRGRLYRSYWAMENYHLRAIRKGRETLLGSRL